MNATCETSCLAITRCPQSSGPGLSRDHRIGFRTGAGSLNATAVIRSFTAALRAVSVSSGLNLRKVTISVTKQRLPAPHGGERLQVLITLPLPFDGKSVPAVAGSIRAAYDQMAQEFEFDLKINFGVELAERQW